MGINAKIQIRSGEQNRRIGGFDSMIVAAKDEDLSAVGGALVVDTNVLTPKLVAYSQDAAQSMGERLHHADWTLTDDPGEVKTLGMMHDCPTCRAGTDQALAYLRDSKKAILVGQLYWVHPDDA